MKVNARGRFVKGRSPVVPPGGIYRVAVLLVFYGLDLPIGPANDIHLD